jgi:hypothetical protein
MTDMFTSRLSTDADLSTLFDIDIEQTEAADADLKALCRKCNGRGNFIGYTGRVIGKCFACNGDGFKLTVDDAAIDVSQIQTAFTAAFGNGIKRPKLRLGTFQFSRAPDTGKNAGSIYVKEGDQYLGKVTDGRFLPVRECGDERKARVIAVACDPASAAKAYGQKTGSCSCCGRELTNKESIELGIGPICAEKFGW